MRKALRTDHSGIMADSKTKYGWTARRTAPRQTRPCGAVAGAQAR
ncbi:hypothetical protein AZ22_2770 [Bordetella bronchiseptica 980-2]|nr:hypothetical protein AZ22_2770 [Bordetella bronchiseptica 980-2]